MSAPQTPASDFPRSDVAPDEELAQAWAMAAWIGQQSPEHTLRSFSSMLVALLHGGTPGQRWWLRYCQSVGIDLQSLYDSLGFRPAHLTALRRRVLAGEQAQGKDPSSASLRSLIDTAVQLSRQRASALGNPTGDLAVLDLILTYLARAPGDHGEQMQRWGFDSFRDVSAALRATMRDEGLVGELTKEQVAEFEPLKRFFASVLGREPDLDAPEPPPPVVISDYAADTPEGEDQLDIDGDVDAMAALVCARAVSPPLSIGLFGDWGSGKSFFIRKLQTRVAEISGAARGAPKPQRELPFYKHVVQIEFNAWNYAEGNLWAALVQHLLENLRLTRHDDDDEVERRRRKLQQQMQLERDLRRDAVRRKRQARRELAEQERQRAQREAAVQRELGRLRKVSALDVIRGVELDERSVAPLNELRDTLGLPAVGREVTAVVDAVAGTRALLQRGVAVLAHVPAGQRGRWALAAAGVLLGPPLLALAVGWLLRDGDAELGRIGAWAAWASTSLGAVAAWLRGANRWAGTQLGLLENLQRRAQQTIDDCQARQQRALAAIEQRIQQARARAEDATAQAAQARDKVQRIQAQLDGTTPASVLADFIDERATSDDYRRHLGLPAMIRRDFARISAMVKQENQSLLAMQTLAQEAAGQATRINRIVLYIDDLDRCNEDRVIEVLAAVHLLLAFELFIVVVAVDARWVTRSLARRYAGLLTDDAQVSAAPPGTHATPYDYLEKIFQVPLWLRPPNETAVTRLLRSLVGVAGTVRAQAAAGSLRGGLPAGASSAQPGTASLTPAAPAAPRTHESKALALEFGDDEVVRIESLVPLLGASPRAIKRFINVYRLFKASLSSDALNELLMPDGDGANAPFEAVLLLLALHNGQPAAARLLGQRWQQLGLPSGDAAPTGMREGVGNGSGDAVGRLTSWGQLLAGVPLPGSAAALAPEFDTLVAWLLASHGEAWRDQPCAPLGRWLGAVARYSYQGIDAGATPRPLKPPTP